jgi:DNA polymerase-1
MDGRLHPRYHAIRLMGAGTGRMSCSAPNVQQIPRGLHLSAIVPGLERVLVKVDYANIEMRIAADIAGDVALIDAFTNGVDVHALTASLVLGVKAETIGRNSPERQQAKAINFGLQYGQGARGLRTTALSNYGVVFTEAEARQFRQRFFDRYRGLKRWHDEYRTPFDAPPVTIETRTPVGGRRLGVSRFTEKLSSPVQGAGADGIKGVLALCFERRHQIPPNAHLVLCVHDELVAECERSDAHGVAEWLKTAMVDGMQPHLGRVPVTVEERIARDWAGTPLEEERR